MAFLHLDSVSYRYPGRSEYAVKETSLQLDRGEVVSLTGLNGSGKSTLARLILGLLHPQSGHVYVEGRPIGSMPLPERGRKLGYILQNPGQMLFTDSVYNEVAFGLRWQGLKGEALARACRESLKLFQLWDLRNSMPLLLSEGQKQLVAICAVMALKPPFLILDEPAKSIDSFRKALLAGILQKINRQGTGILLISHERSIIEALDGKEIRMHKGVITAA